MAYYIDLSPCDYFDVRAEVAGTRQKPETIPEIKWAHRLRAVGWLDGTHPFPRGTVPAAVQAKLGELIRNYWEPCHFFGWHTCELCSSGEEGSSLRGIKNIFVPGDGFLYVAPEMILHYIDRHAYLPPLEFHDAVCACPLPRSPSYLEAVKAIVPREVFDVFGED